MLLQVDRSRIQPWLLVALLWVVATLNYLDRQVIFSLFPLLEKDLHATAAQLGLTSTVFLWVYGLLSPFAGYLADRFGRVRIIVASLLVWSAVTWLTGHARNMTELLAARALMGISEACYLPAALALIAEKHSERSRSLATGLHQSGLYTGIVLGGALGGWVGQTYGWRPIFGVLGGVGVAYAVVLALALRGAEAPVVAERQAFTAAFRELMKTRGVPAVVAAFALFSVAGWIVYTWLPAYLYERFGMTLAAAGFSATFYIQAASYIGVVIGGILADRWSQSNPRARLLTQAAGLAVGAPFLFMVGLAASQPLLVFALIAYGLGRGFYDANTMPVLSQLAEPHLRATGYGVMNLAACLMGGIGAAAAGWLKSEVGLSAAFETSAVCLAAGAWLLWRLRLRA
ncbi:MAG: MFS transporter [Bryobacterales bacterium]|nr:MFS transporter [Bryobacterales bacterium]